MGQSEAVGGGGVCFKAHIAPHFAGPAGSQRFAGGQGRSAAGGGHFHFVDRAVGIDGDGLDAHVAGAGAVVGGAVIEDIPLAVEAFQRAVVVPGLRVAAKVVHNDAAVGKAGHGVVGDGITHGGGPAAMAVGIRVDKEALLRQLALSGQEERKELYFHKRLLNDTLPLSIGGGIGQSRLCMLYLQKAHIGEIQASIWPEDMRKECADWGMQLI